MESFDKQQAGTVPTVQAPASAPEGYKLVPVDAYLACEKALREYSQVPPDYHLSVLRLRDAVKALLAASPAQQADAKDARTDWERGCDAYNRWCNEQDIHCNRLPSFRELDAKEQARWIKRAFRSKPPVQGSQP